MTAAGFAITRAKMALDAAERFLAAWDARPFRCEYVKTHATEFRIALRDFKQAQSEIESIERAFVDRMPGCVRNSEQESAK